MRAAWTIDGDSRLAVGRDRSKWTWTRRLTGTRGSWRSSHRTFRFSVNGPESVQTILSFLRTHRGGARFVEIVIGKLFDAPVYIVKDDRSECFARREAVAPASSVLPPRGDEGSAPARHTKARAGAPRAGRSSGGPLLPGRAPRVPCVRDARECASVLGGYVRVPRRARLTSRGRFSRIDRARARQSR